MKRSLMILGLLVVLLGGVVAGGCRHGNQTDESGAEAATVELTVTEPLNETTVNTASIGVKGRTEADSVVTVNEAVVEVDAEGRFGTSVILEEGPNLIEVVASSFDDDKAQSHITLWVIYEKP